MKTLTTAFRDEKNKLNSSGIIRLFKIYTTTPLYFAEYDKDVTFDSNTYVATPMSSTDVSENITGTIDSISVTVGNANRDMIALIQSESLLDVQVDMIEVFENNLADPNSCVRDIYYISNISVTQESATFTLDSLLMRVGIQIPRMTYSKGSCQWKYKSTQCGFDVGYSNVVFTASTNSIAWGATTIGATSINSGSVAFTSGNPVYIYYIEGNSTLATNTEQKVPELLQKRIPKEVLLCKYFGGSIYKRYWSKTVDVIGYPNAVTASCDFSYKGANGCFAHNNSIRYGGFPGVGRGRVSL